MDEQANALVDCRSMLGEGPLWHPEADRLYWFDIMGCKMMRCDAEGDERRSWDFEDMVSAAGWIDKETLLIASERALFRFHTESGEAEDICALEADNPVTRSNDGRADPQGGFWIGTMGKDTEPGAGSIYRYRRGELIHLIGGITVSNSICFSPDGSLAYFSDSTTRRIMRWPLDPESGDPVGAPDVFANLSDEPGVPDGSIVDAEGHLWTAEWGAGRAVRRTPAGGVDRIVALPVPRVTCPALGGAGLKRLFITSARQGMSDEALDAAPLSGDLFAVDVDVPGRPEPRVLL